MLFRQSKKGILTKEDLPTIDCDGKTGLSIYNKWFIESEGTHASLDKLFSSYGGPYPKALLKYVTIRSNAYTTKL